MIKALLEQIDKKTKTANDYFAVFDFDNTCVVNDIAEATLNYTVRNDLFKDASILPDLADGTPKEISRAIFDHYYELLNAGDVQGAYEFGAKTLSGWSVDSIKKLLSDVFVAEGEDIGSAILFDRKIAKGLKARPIIIDLIKELQKRGIKIWIVSASPAPLVAAAMKRLNINTELIGVKNVIKDGLLTAELEQPMPVMNGKVECIKKFIGSEKRPVLGVGDSINDLPMLEYSTLKAVVNRHNALSDLATASSWILLDA